ncbi:MAG: glutamate synthase large subunit [Thermodesulfovibrionales bacterium]
MHTASSSGSCGIGFVCSLEGTRSHAVVQWGAEALANLTHRGAIGADGKTGDGAGVLTQIPRELFAREITHSGFRPPEGDLAVGVFFLYAERQREIEEVLAEQGFLPLGWREVPTRDDALGQAASATKPAIRHLLLDTAPVEPRQREARLYLARRSLERKLGSEVYVPSLSSKTIVYKGLLMANRLADFYPDLTRGDYESAFCIFHQRFSTNTSPEWNMAQPFRALAHNGEINTIQGNRNWMLSLEHEIRHELLGDDAQLLSPLVSSEESDSASLDRIVELLILSGLSAAHAVNRCVPPAWEHAPLSERARAFFQYQSFLMRPWDGPAALVFSDGDTVGAHLDRNGLRPLRYTVTGDGFLIVGSETGMIDFGERAVREKGRLGPGDTLLVDFTEGRVRHTEEIVEELARQKPYHEWIREHLVWIKGGAVPAPRLDGELQRQQAAFGYTEEELRNQLRVMAETGREMTFSMGDDTPLPPLAKRPPLLFRYFKQRFSQVTNPPIDYLRERSVMSLRMNAGHKRNFLYEKPESARRVQMDSPLLLESTLRGVEKQTTITFERIPTTFSCTASLPFLSDALRSLQETVINAARRGIELVILSDIDITRKHAALPSLLALSASFKALQRERLANRTSIVVETGEARDIHHVACLIGYGATAVYPWLVFRTLYDLCSRGELALSFEQAALNYKRAVEEGLLKVMARMGISTLNSYHGAQLFDSLCLNREVVDEFFTRTPVSIEADGLDEIEESLLLRHNSGYELQEPSLEYGGELRHRKEGEWHAWSAPAVIALNRFIASPGVEAYRSYSRTAAERPVYLRDLLSYKGGTPVPLEEVEAEQSILGRFFSGAMSIGALSPEAHETIAEACNRLGIRSNSGEGGEDPVRYGGITNSAIKQIASGRFGVTPAYIASAQELEIKIAQGAKPGEGGHLPASKVTPYIAMLRHCSPHIPLISPPPHHDIYSIEDLAQLINDLKEANPAAKVCVKLVAEAGVGTIAAGAAKAYADIVQISGCEGGTGASPIGSIKCAGNYWETGLAETQRALMENGLRQRVRVRVDGGIRTGRDVVVAALLGAEEFGFGTATMVACGCVLARQCHLNTCPRGIATQDERLRRKFSGRVEGVMAYFTTVAREVRGILSRLGARSLGGIVGNAALLRSAPEGLPPGAGRIRPAAPFGVSTEGPKTCLQERNDNPTLHLSLNRRLVEDLLPFIERAEAVEREYAIRNVDRSIPASLNYHISLKYGDAGLPDETLRLIFRGTAGQSFGAFTHRGLSLTLFGDANDYVGKGMFGGRIVVRPLSGREEHSQVIAGNTVLYGAVGGELFVAGKAGERFGVRNSGAVAVVEGAGHHLCEYMTRGAVVVLGDAGYNIGAGMTGGAIYWYDESGRAEEKINGAYVTSSAVTAAEEAAELKLLMERHYRFTESSLVRALLADFGAALLRFVKIVPLTF